MQKDSRNRIAVVGNLPKVYVANFARPSALLSIAIGKMRTCHGAFLAILFLFTAAPVSAQHISCSGDRYLNEITTSLTIVNGIQYGLATPQVGGPQNLLFDLYEPAGDTAQKRALLVLAHGGGFLTGTRANIAGQAEAFAKRGYLVAAIDYRLTDPNYADTLTFFDGAVKARSDMLAAVRFFAEDAAGPNLYRADSNFVFVGGTSAGATIALLAGMWDANDTTPAYLQTLITNNGGWQGESSTNLQHSQEVRGVMSYSGAMARASFIDAADPVLFSAHDDMDEIVRFDSGLQVLTSGFEVYVAGSQSLHNQAVSMGLESHLFPIPLSTEHVSFFNSNSALYELPVIDQSSQVMFNIVCDTELPINIESVSVLVDGRDAKIRWAVGRENQISHFEIERRSAGADWSSVHTVQADSPSLSTDYSYVNSGLAVGGYEFRIASIGWSGVVSYSRIIEVSILAQSGNMRSSVYPNPVADHPTVLIELSESSLVQLELFDAIGRSVVKEPGSHFSAGAHRIRLGSNSLAPGTYFLVIRAGDASSRHSLVVLR